MKFIITLLCFFVLLGCSGESVSEESTSKETASKESVMFGLFGKKEEEKYVISSPLEGVLVKDGKPLPRTKITRYLSWTGYEGEKVDEFFTDDHGRFTIPAYEEMLNLGTLNQFVGKTLLIAVVNSKEIDIWLVAKFDGEIYSDLQGPLEGLVCDVNTTKSSLKVKHSIISTKCRWQGMPEIKEEF
ncbi:MAG: hypothetical protein ACJAS1_006483 [Oleiphilaceae bacterium]|jgi:hypothetical protein